MRKRWNYKRERALIDTIKGIYFVALRECQPHEEILRQLRNRVYTSEYYTKQAPSNSIDRISSYAFGMADFLYTHLEWRSRLDGKLVTKDQIPAGRWCDVKPGAFVYKANPEKIFSDSSDFLPERKNEDQRATTVREIIRHDNAKRNVNHGLV